MLRLFPSPLFLLHHLDLINGNHYGLQPGAKWRKQYFESKYKKSIGLIRYSDFKQMHFYYHLDDGLKQLFDRWIIWHILEKVENHKKNTFDTFIVVLFLTKRILKFKMPLHFSFVFLTSSALSSTFQGEDQFVLFQKYCLKLLTKSIKNHVFP